MEDINRAAPLFLVNLVAPAAEGLGQIILVDLEVQELPDKDILVDLALQTPLAAAEELVEVVETAEVLVAMAELDFSLLLMEYPNIMLAEGAAA